MIKELILALFVVQVAYATDHSNKAQVLNFQNEHDDLPNKYQFSYDTSDGSSRSETGILQNPDTDHAALDVHGSMKWTSDDGSTYEMTYKAGKYGYRTIIKKIS